MILWYLDINYPPSAAYKAGFSDGYAAFLPTTLVASDANLAYTRGYWAGEALREQQLAESEEYFNTLNSLS